MIWGTVFLRLVTLYIPLTRSWILRSEQWDVWHSICGDDYSPLTLMDAVSWGRRWELEQRLRSLFSVTDMCIQGYGEIYFNKFHARLISFNAPPTWYFEVIECHIRSWTDAIINIQRWSCDPPPRGQKRSLWRHGNKQMHQGCLSLSVSMDLKLSFPVKVNGTKLGLKLIVVSWFINATRLDSFLSAQLTRVSLPAGRTKYEADSIFHCPLCKD